MCGDDGEKVTPVPIPNTEVKLLSADCSEGFPFVRVGRCRAINKHSGLSNDDSECFFGLSQIIVILEFTMIHLKKKVTIERGNIMEYKFEKYGNGYRQLDATGHTIAEITFEPLDENTVAANHTFVDPSLRGQGVAEKLLDHLADAMRKENKKIVAQCSYVVEQFNRKPDKYADVIADKN